MICFLYESKAYKLTPKNAIDLENFVFKLSGVNEMLKESGLQKESFTSMLEKI